MVEVLHDVSVVEQPFSKKINPSCLMSFFIKKDFDVSVIQIVIRKAECTTHTLEHERTIFGIDQVVSTGVVWYYG